MRYRPNNVVMFNEFGNVSELDEKDCEELPFASAKNYDSTSKLVHLDLFSGAP